MKHEHDGVKPFLRWLVSLTLWVHNMAHMNNLLRGSRRQSAGFTIVELIIVIIVVAILAALSVVGFNAVRGSAAEASLKSDLEKGAAVLESERQKAGKYATSIDGIAGLEPSDGNNYILSSYNRGFCLSVASTNTNKTFYFTSRTNKIQEGTCEGDVATTAGSGVLGNADGTGTLAQIGYPTQIALGPDGNFYIGQANGYMGLDDAIRKMTPAGVVTTLHNGSSFTGYGGFAIASNGTIYATDMNARRIKTVTPAGVVTNWAGTGVAGTAEGPIANAQFNSPQGLAFDSTGNLYVVDSLNFRIRKITPDGTVSTLAGSTYGFNDATGTAAQFGSMDGIVVDSNDNIYVTDWDNHRIRKITPAGVVTTFAGNNTYASVDGVGTAAQFMSPIGIAIDSLDNIYVTDADANKVRKITPDGTVTTIVGGGPVGAPIDGEALDVRLSTPRAIAVDANGDLYVADGGTNRIRKFVNP